MCNCKVDAFSQQTETLETESRPSQVSPIFVKVSVSTFEIKVQVQDQYVLSKNNREPLWEKAAYQTTPPQKKKKNLKRDLVY